MNHKVHLDKTANSKTMRGFVCTLSGGILWGFSGTCGQYLFTYKNMDSSWLTVTRMFVAGILLLLFSVPKHKSSMMAILKNRISLGHLLIFSILGLTTCQYTYLTAISYSNAGTATVLQYLAPVLILFLSCILSLRLPSFRETIAIFLAIGGTFLLVTHGNLHTLVISSDALFWGLASAVALMLYTMLPGDLIRRFGSTVVTGYGMLFGGIFLFFLTRYWTMEIFLDPGALLGLAAIILFGTALPFTLYLQGVSDIGSIKASMTACIEPVSATIFSALWLHTSFTLMDIAGLICITITVLLLAKK